MYFCLVIADTTTATSLDLRVRILLTIKSPFPLNNQIIFSIRTFQKSSKWTKTCAISGSLFNGSNFTRLSRSLWARICTTCGKIPASSLHPSELTALVLIFYGILFLWVGIDLCQISLWGPVLWSLFILWASNYGSSPWPLILH